MERKILVSSSGHDIENSNILQGSAMSSAMVMAEIHPYLFYLS